MAVSLLKQLPRINSLGFHIFDPIWALKDHSSNTIELIYIVEGKVSLLLDGQTFQAQKGEVLIIPSKSVHRDEFDFDSGFETFMVHFHWEGEQNFFSQYSNHDLQHFSESDRADIAKIIDSMQNDLFEGDSEYNQLLLGTRCLTILLLMLKIHQQSQTDPAESERLNSGKRKRLALIKQAKIYLEEHYPEVISLDDIAQNLRVSPYHLSHVFSQESNFSLFSYLTSLRMGKAKSLLIKGNLNVSEVATAVGYNNESYFSKVFKRYFNNTPSHFVGFNGK